MGRGGGGTPPAELASGGGSTPFYDGEGSVAGGRLASRPLRVARIRAYPLKGAGGFDLLEVGMDAFGIPGDRRWMLVRPDGLFISQRTHPRLALIQVSPLPSEGEPPPGGGGGKGVDGLSFQLRAPGMEPFLLDSSSHSGARTEVRIHRDTAEGVVVEGAEEWFSGFLRQECRLVYSPPGFRRPVDPSFAPGHRTSFSDGYPLLLTLEESLADLNRRLRRPSSMLRFRPNLVLRGGEAWEEDTWRVLEIGGVHLELVRPCARCSVTTVDPGTAVRGKEPLRTLGGFRGWEGKAYFGQNAVFSGNGSFRVGDNVRILEEGEARPPIGR
jgi:uncharacterized protein YcbX